MILTGLLFLPLLFIFPLFLLKKETHLKILGFSLSVLHLVYGAFVAFKFDKGNLSHQMVELANLFKPLGIHYSLGVDGLSLLLCALSLILMPLIILGTWKSMGPNVKPYLIGLFSLQICMLGTFLSLDLILFYLFFEASLIPMLLLMGIYGGKERIFAAKKFFIFTFSGSILLLGSIITMMILFESVNGYPSSLMADLQLIQLPFVKNTIFSTQTVLFFGFFLAFAVKAPLFPLHTWLPDAHVEAPTGGSVILAGLMLKMGTYGMIRFLGMYFPQASGEYSWAICILAIMGIIYGAMVAFAQTDMKKLVAYSSVSHMGYIVLGIFCWNEIAHQGASFQMISHGLSTGALFLMIGMLYERFKTREMSAYGGLAKVMPNFTIFFFIITFSSIAVPLTNGFIGEFLILTGAFAANKYYGIFAAAGIFLGASYMLNMVKKVFFGPVTEKFKNLKDIDLSIREMAVLSPIVIMIFLTGIYPSLITDVLEKPGDEISREYVEGEGQYATK
ncbi:MAG: complex I subunit 4 family protein [Bdellovibrionales bacterium]